MTNSPYFKDDFHSLKYIYIDIEDQFIFQGS